MPDFSNRMKNYRIIIFLLLVLTDGFCYAGELTATVTAYDAVALSGDVPAALSADYIQENHYKGRITAGTSAILTLEHCPKMQCTGGRIRMHSNQNAGAGRVCLSVNNQVVWSLPESSFADWVGYYSNDWVTLDIPFSQLLPRESTIELIIEATVNSLYLDQLTLVYELLPPEPYTVFFQTQTDHVLEPLSEESAESGVVLPEFTYEADGWTFVGWIEYPTDTCQSKPLVFSPGTRYFPLDHCTLYALYSNQIPASPLAPDSLYADGDYCLVAFTGSDYVSACGDVENGAIPMAPISVQILEDIPFLMMNHMPSQYRYRMIYDGDSVFITHATNPIGYSSGSLTQGHKAWHYLPAAQSSLALYHDYQSGSGKAHTLYISTLDTIPYLKDINLFLMDTLTYIWCYNVDQLPLTAPEVLYSSYPLGDALIDSVSVPVPRAIILWENGRWIICTDNHKFTINGQRIE